MRAPGRPPAPLVAAVVLALLAAGGAAAVLEPRMAAEQAARPVEVVADLAAVETLARAEGRPLPDVLRALKAAGVSGLGVSELTPRRLAWAGHASLYTGAALLGLAAEAGELHPLVAAVLAGPDFAPAHAYVIVDRSDLAARAAGLCRRFSPCRVHAGDGRWIIAVGAGLAQVADAGLGFWTDDLAVATAHGFRVALRPVGGAADGGALDAVLAEPLAWLAARPEISPGLAPVIFAGGAVPGAVDGLGDTAALLRDRDLRLGAVARPGGRGYVAQAGLAELVGLMEGRTVRVASAPAELLADARPAALADWWLYAVQRRNARVVYVRPAGGPEPLAATAGALRRLDTRLEAARWPRGPAEPLAPVRPERWQRLALAAGGPALALWLIRRAVRPGAGILVVSSTAAVLGAYVVLDGLAPGSRPLGWVALGGAILLPAAAVDLLLERVTRRNQTAAVEARRLETVGDLLVFGLAVLAGAAWLAALTADAALWLEVRTVPGTGAAGTAARWALTLGLAAAVGLRSGHRGAGWPSDLIAAARRPLTIGDFVLVAALFGTAAATWWARDWLATALAPAVEGWLGGVPRGAEALLAFPAAMLAGWVARRHPAWLPAVALAAAAGPAVVAAELLAGTVPFTWVVRRTILGWVIGLAVGALAVRLATRAEAARPGG